MGFESILAVKFHNNNVDVDFGSGWKTEIECQEFVEILDNAHEKLKKASPPKKGLGKGKPDKKE